MPEKPGGKVKTHDGAVFTGATVHEAAVFACKAGYKAHQIFEMSGKDYTPPKPAPAAPATPTPITTTTTTTTPPLRMDSNGEPPMKTSAFKAVGSVFLGIAEKESQGMMTKLAIVASVLAVVAIFAGLAFGGRYTTRVAQPFVYVVDRFTGSVRVCHFKECWPTVETAKGLSEATKK